MRQVIFFEGYLVSYSRTFIVNCAGFITDNTSMKFIGNLLWLILGGLLVSVCYFIAGLLYCITIIGIPFGYQLWKFGVFSLWPFGTEVVDGNNAGGCLSIFMNILWILLGWWEIAAAHLVCGLICCITIIGIPFGLQHFKIALLSLTPFGKTFQS